MEPGSRIWVTDGKDGWSIATVVSKSGKEVTATLKSTGEEVTRKVTNDSSTCEAYSIMGAEPGLLKSIDDLTHLPALHEPALLQALQERFDSDQIYTWVGPILIAVNPFRKIPNLYQTKRWIANDRGLPPHVYGLADATFKAMVDFNGQSQSILVSGESGAGKTETTKYAMQYLTEVSHSGGHDVSSKILQANPLLEAFGNAKTVRNDNSSRFGKLIEMRFANQGRHKLLGAGITSYLLEKARIVHQARGERNYHIFYELFAGYAQQCSRWKLTSPKAHRYLNASDEYSRADVSDTEQFQKTLTAMQTLGFSSEDCDAVFEIVAGVLHLGDVEFQEEKGGEACSVKNPEAVKACADCLGLQPGKCSEKSLTDPDKTLSDVLCVRTMQGAGEEVYIKTFSAQFAREARDALAMSIYERLFAWIVWRVNYSMTGGGSGANEHHRDGEDGEDRKYRIGILDIFGFEVFEDNYFEQLCINYANEQLQRQFNEHVFELEQRMYEKEGVDWTFVEFPDNSATITMIENKPIGLLALIDEECIYPNGNDRSLHAKLVQNLKQFDRFACPQTQQRDFCFTIKHFAGDVTYTVDGFYRKNKNELRQDAVELICASNKFLLRVLLPPDSQEAAGGADAAKYFDKRVKQLGAKVLACPGSAEAKQWQTKALPAWEKDMTALHHSRVKSSGRRSQIQQTTVSSHFKTQLHAALAIIRASKPSYVRCLKPNDRNKPNIFTRNRVLNQLRYSGVVEVIKVARAGYPTRFDLAMFVDRYAVLISVANSNQKNAGLLEARRLIRAQDPRALSNASTSICVGAGLQKNTDFQIGKTKVFLRAEATAKLELAKANKIKGAVRLIQRAWRRYFTTHRADRAAKKIQRLFRGFLVRKRYAPEFTRRKAAAEFIHSSPNMKRWVRHIREQVRANGGGGRKTKQALLKSSQADFHRAKEAEDIQQIWWLAIPVVVLIAVPTLASSSPTLLGLVLLACIGATLGSFLVLDAQRRGVLDGAGNAFPATRGAVKKVIKKPFAKAIDTKRRAQAAVFSKSPPLSPRSQQRQVEITVNGEALKRFAGLATKRKEAMERARQKAEDMYFAGQLPVKPVTAPALGTPTKVPPPMPPRASAHSTTPSKASSGPSMPSHPKPNPSVSATSAASRTPTNSLKSALKKPTAPSPLLAPPPSDSGKPRADTSKLDPEEQYHLNKAILAMFLEDQAPNQLDMADDLLKEFQGKEEQLFDKLTEEFPHVDVLHSDASKNSSETPVWDRFVRKRKSSIVRRNRSSRGSRGFFGTIGPSLEDEIRAVQEASVKPAMSSVKQKMNSAKKKTEDRAKHLLGKWTS